MSERELCFPEYGLGSDYAGARRNRRTFRFFVVACVSFSAVLFFSEGYLRYDLDETQYLKALTLAEQSAQPILRMVVKRDADSNDNPSVKYIEALAAVEEIEEVLPRYEQAYRLNPSNASLIINYGCRLYFDGQYREARERFREAGVQPRKDALPRYLEAAALIASLSSEAGLTEVMTLVTRPNNSGDPVLFPQPLWHPSLPKSGAWYANLKRGIVDRCCAVLYRFKDALIGRAREQVDLETLRDWDQHLEQLEQLGGRLLGNENVAEVNLGIPQAIAGIQIQLDAVRERRRLITLSREAGEGLGLEAAAERQRDTAFIEREVKLENGLGILEAFERVRDVRIAVHRQVLLRPLVLCASALVLLFCVYLVAYLVSKLVHSGRKSWALPHTKLAKAFILGGLGISLLLLLVQTLTKDLGILEVAQNSGTPSPWLGNVANLWYAVLAAVICFGFLYPFLALPGVHEAVARRTSQCNRDESGALDEETLLAMARRARREVGIVLTRRYFGILLGSFVCMICVWMMGYRIFESIYPTQIEMLVTGLESQELDIVREVQALLL